jgi:hypothetical protein
VKKNYVERQMSRTWKQLRNRVVGFLIYAKSAAPVGNRFLAGAAFFTHTNFLGSCRDLARNVPGWGTTCMYILYMEWSIRDRFRRIHRALSSRVLNI